MRVFAPSFFNLSALDDDGYVLLPEGADVNGLLKELKVPFPLRPLAFYTVNSRRAKMRDKLKEGDVVSILAITAGG